MSVIFGRFTRALLIVGFIAGAIALPALVGTPFMPANDGSPARVALAAPGLERVVDPALVDDERASVGRDREELAEVDVRLPERRERHRAPLPGACARYLLFIGRHVRVASSHGARVNLLANLVPRGLGSASPDATVTFTRVDGQDLELDIYRPHSPPTLISIPDNDHLVANAGALRFIEEATRAGVQVRTVRFPWADHAVNLLYHGVTNQAMVQITLRHSCQHGGQCAHQRCLRKASAFSSGFTVQLFTVHSSLLPPSASRRKRCGSSTPCTSRYSETNRRISDSGACAAA